ncbi:hypothetical protein V6N13_018889 [Hibiscus sabdariffa]
MTDNWIKVDDHLMQFPSIIYEMSSKWALVSSGPADMVWPVVLVCLPATATMSASQESALLLRIAMLPVSPGVENGGWSGTSSTQA